MFRSASRPVVIRNAVVGTITLTSVLIIYDGWATLRFGDVVAIIAGPVLAIFVAHAFAGALGKVAVKGGVLGRKEVIDVVWGQSGFLLLAVPPLALLAALNLAGVALEDSIRVVIWFGAASLGFWGGLAGVRAGLHGWRIVLAVAMGLLVGALVLGLQVILQPGKTVSNGVAMIRVDETESSQHAGSSLRQFPRGRAADVSQTVNWCAARWLARVAVERSLTLHQMLDAGAVLQAAGRGEEGNVHASLAGYL
jgi:hypothetical protein